MSLSAANDSQVKIVCRNGDKRAVSLGIHSMLRAYIPFSL
ncbi:hypothetical protein VCHC51A1_2562 [Vibrio cholerae HC-51A1]|nr:hypothetical protein VCHC02A1_2636 [Vibrio cholerae HC-02A1]EKG48954.1 hypothetical protein VCHC50A1_2668 [Vibrio cholerae HC-50A1]EKG54582.1 hypothetical protein VCHC52A1_2669 [Vibrio cholerae HC-52A1]EKG59289.1 hypothetical protein VCHC56A1_2739 [Vibrio cholerae HC-56A1]EKG67933.1 hypothetical protein VCHC57A1_2559 [Vibrio cholerae HC-57A1]EKG88511.1 hypothetical protein VCHC51A1_2562 [Vibrio cholerae HC-51A1]EKL01824.1 hypothetical protein VCHC41B1_2927 [Vibrio cholerae HC-41B1]EKL0658